MKLLMENWRIFIKNIRKEEEGEHGFKYLSASPWGAEDAEQEWGEEIITSLDNGDEYIDKRWPGLSKEIIEKKYPYLLTVEDFADALAKAPLENLSLSEMREIHNHAQVHEIIDMYNDGDTSEEIYNKIYTVFKEYDTDRDKTGKTYPKEKSYQRWVDKFKDSDSIDKPSIVLELPDGELAHVGGHTRQTGALTNKKISPYAVLYPIDDAR
tara:strand:+ start:590 stop:1222 length:633 start_codon:yes stop_codon:yes gene_type:complete